MNCQLGVSTFAAGLLAKAGHDLLFAVSASVQLDGKSEFAIDAGISSGSLRVECDLGSLAYRGVRTAKGFDPAGLSAAEVARVEETARKEVLRAERFPEASFDGDVQGETISGQLSLCGQKGAVVGTWRQGGFARFELVPSRFGITPYRALMGALRVQDRVVVEFPLPLLTT